MLQAIQDRVAELFPYCYTSYAHPLWLFYSPDVVLSQEGTQQRDPSRSSTVQQHITTTAAAIGVSSKTGLFRRRHSVWLIHVVAADRQTIVTEGEAMCLCLNNKKFEVIAHQQTVISDPTLRSFNRVNVDDTELLGAPSFAGGVLDTAWASRCSELSSPIERLELTCAQDAVTLLRVSFSAPRVQHLMRCSPSVDNPALTDFDKLLRCAISHLTSCDLSDEQWLQASLPINMAVLGVKSVVAGTSSLSGIGCKDCITSEYHV